MTILYRVHLNKVHLDQIPGGERTFYLMASQLSNELNIMSKLLWFASNRVPDHEVRSCVGTTQELLMIKMMAGRLYEGRALLNRAFSAKGFWEKYKTEISPRAADCFVQINSYFGRANLIEKIRNKFAFHMDVPVIEAMYALVPHDAPFVDYLAAEHSGHNLFYGGEWLTISAMLEAADEADWQTALTRIFHETTKVSVWFCLFIQEFVGLMLRTYVGLTMDDLLARRIDVSDDPPIDEVRLPFFCPPPKTTPAAQ